jgi:hypothetical protein
MNRRAYRLGVVMAALTMAAAVLLRAFADAAYLSRFPDRLPWLFVGGAVATAAATLGYDRLRRHARTHAGIDLVLLGVLLVLAGLTPAGLAAGGQAPPCSPPWSCSAWRRWPTWRCGTACARRWPGATRGARCHGPAPPSPPAARWPACSARCWCGPPAPPACCRSSPPGSSWW